MKEITKMSRLTGLLEKAFRLINADFFNNELPMPVITVVSTEKAYAHYTPWDAWDTKHGGKHEINISSAYLNRPLENIVASLVHECVHFYNDYVLNVQDTSRCGTYHNRIFKQAAEEHGLTVSRSDRYGWCITEPSDDLILWLCDHDELREIEMCRALYPTAAGIGTHSNSGGTFTRISTRTSSTRKLQCPCCGNSVRATKPVNILCLDCMEVMTEV